MIHDNNKTERVLKLLQLLKSHPQGLLRKDLARLLNIDPATICRYIRDISLNLPVCEDTKKRIYLEPDRFKINMEMSIHELIFVHLASRLFLRSLDRYNPYAADCLEKLACLFAQFSPDISRFLRQTVKELAYKSDKNDKEYLTVLKDLTTAWILQRKIRLKHYSYRRKIESNYLFHPYWLEPSSGKASVYAIGYSEEEKQYRTLKIDRIRQSEILKCNFTIRKDFKIEDYLDHAWGIWKSDEPPLEIVLRFSEAVTDRVLENSWHEEEKKELLPDGSLIWRAYVSQPREMYPWIRGWGGDVEVLQPLELRRKMKDEAEKMKKIYEK
jgi:predicted DNA-binding transcriptional regulator YafY